MLENSSEFIYCQTCANEWELTDAATAFYFRSTDASGVLTADVGSYTSPAVIVAAAGVMTFCPKCDVERLEPTPIPGAPPGVKGRDPFYRKDDVMTGANVDAGRVPDADAGEADNAVTHRTEDTV